MKTLVGSLAVAVALACGAWPARAETSTTALDFAVSQSLWGSGGSASVGASESLDLGVVTFTYDIGLSSGTVDAAFKGLLSADHPTALGAPGSAAVTLSYAGLASGGRLASDLGAWLKVHAIVDLIDEGYSLNIDRGFVPQLGPTISGNDDFTAAGLGVDVGVAKVGARFDIEQTDRFTPTAIGGLLDYGLRGSGSLSTLPFSLASSADLPLTLDLGQPGVWDFSFRDLKLVNSFSTSFDVALTIYEEHVGGVKICRKRVLGVTVSYPCGLTYDGNELQLADIPLPEADPFGLDFNEISTGPAFSIAVGTAPIPEPGTWPLLAAGLAALAIRSLRSRRVARPRAA